MVTAESRVLDHKKYAHGFFSVGFSDAGLLDFRLLADKKSTIKQRVTLPQQKSHLIPEGQWQLLQM